MKSNRQKKAWHPIRLEEDLDRIVEQVRIEQQFNSWSDALRYVIRQYADLRRIVIQERIDCMQFSELLSKMNNIEEVLKEYIQK